MGYVSEVREPAPWGVSLERRSREEVARKVDVK